MKSFLLTIVLLNCLFVASQTQSQEFELNVGFDTSVIEVKRGKKEIFLPLKLSFESKNTPKKSLGNYKLDLKINQEETDINNQFYTLHSKSLLLSQLKEEETIFLEIAKDTLPDRKRKLVIDIQLLSEDKLFDQINKAQYRKLEVFLNPYVEVDFEKQKKSIPTDGPNQFYIDFVGTANLQANLSEASDEVQGAAGLGVIFERYFLNKSKDEKALFDEQKKGLQILKDKRNLEKSINRLKRKIKTTEEKIKEDENSSNQLEKQRELEKRLKLVNDSAKSIVIDKKFKRFIESLDMEAYINVASSVDSLGAVLDSSNVTNKRLFGNYVLNPVSSKQSVFINSDVYFNPELLWVRGGWITKWISGANFRINASNVLWSLVEEDDYKSRFAGALNLRFGLFHEFLPNDKIRDDKNRRKYSVRLGLNYTFRELTGDISSQTNDLIRNQFLGTTDTSFSGIEPSFGFRLNNIIAEFSMPMIGGAGRDDIEGLTDTQFLFSIRFVGGFSIKLDDKTSTDD